MWTEWNLIIGTVGLAPPLQNNLEILIKEKSEISIWKFSVVDWRRQKFDVLVGVGGRCEACYYKRLLPDQGPLAPLPTQTFSSQNTSDVCVWSSTVFSFLIYQNKDRDGGKK